MFPKSGIWRIRKNREAILLADLGSLPKLSLIQGRLRVIANCKAVNQDGPRVREQVQTNPKPPTGGGMALDLSEIPGLPNELFLAEDLPP